MQRVKVYHLNEDGHWDDKGTGVIKVETAEHPTSDVHLIIESDADSSRLLNHTVVPGQSYQRQGDDTIITWTETTVGTEIALSFQEAFTCGQVWTEIQRVQEAGLSPRAQAARQQDRQWRPAAAGEAHDALAAHHTYEESAGLMHGPHLTVGSGQGSPGREVDRESETGPIPTHSPDLPSPEFGNLPAIARALSEASLFHKDRLVNQFSAPAFLDRLLELFRLAEDLEDEESLQHLHIIFRSAIMLNDTALIEHLFSDPAFMDVVGALEYEPGVAPASRPAHRIWLREHENFREPVAISDPAVRTKIQDIYRLGYVKDVVMPRFLDDAVLATLRSLALFNSVEVAMALTADPHALPALLAGLAGGKPGSQAWKDALGFLQELTGLAKHLQASQRAALFEKLASLGLFEVMTQVFEHGDPDLQLRASDILLVGALHDPDPLRAFLLSTPGEHLFSLMIQALLRGGPGGMQEQVLEMLRILLDPDTMDGTTERDAFIDAFYATHAGELVNALVTGTSAAAAVGEERRGSGDAGNGPGSLTPAGLPHAAALATVTAPPLPAPRTLGLVVDLLCYCVTQHSYRIKYYTLRNNVVEKVLRLLGRRERWLAVAAIRFLRTCLGIKDEFYNRYLAKNSLLEPVITALLENGSRYNLLNSVILELFEFIWRENMKGLLASIVGSKRWPELHTLDYTTTFSRLLLKHEQNEERNGGATGVAGNGTEGSARGGGAANAAHARAAAAAERRRIRGEKEEDEDEEAYFKEDEGLACGPGGSSGGDGSPSQSQEDVAVPPSPTLSLPSTSSLLNGLTPFPGRLVDYDDDDDDALPIAVLARPSELGKRSASPPLQKRFRPASPAH